MRRVDTPPKPMFQSYFDDVAVPVFALLPSPQVSIRGFKDIEGWSTQSLAMLHTTFPCARIVYSVAKNPAGPDQVKAYETAFKMSPVDAKNYSQRQAVLQSEVKKEHDSDVKR